MRVKFKGREYLTMYDKLEGPLATQEQYDSFDESFAYIEDGKIMRYQVEIGTVDDLEIISNEILTN